MADVIYILTNEAMPGYIKIGKTKSNLIGRIKSLDTTGLPLPFECFFAAIVADCDSAEKLLHDSFADNRVRKNREFFEISPERVASALKLAVIEEVTPRDDIVETKDDEVALNKARARRSRFNFNLVNIPSGSTLTHAKNDQITCSVINSRTVEYDGTQMSLSQAALEVVHSLGYNWKAVSGPEYGLFDGTTLDELRRELEENS